MKIEEFKNRCAHLERIAFKKDAIYGNSAGDAARELIYNDYCAVIRENKATFLDEYELLAFIMTCNPSTQKYLERKRKENGHALKVRVNMRH